MEQIFTTILEHIPQLAGAGVILLCFWTQRIDKQLTILNARFNQFLQNGHAVQKNIDNPSRKPVKSHYEHSRKGDNPNR